MSRTSKVLLIGGSIVVLLGTALPAFIRARSTSASEACIHNLRLIHAVKSLWELERYRLGPATEAFVRDQKIRGAVPDTVTFRELVSGGYLSNSEVAMFSNAEVTVSVKAPQLSPKAIWIRLRFADGLKIAQAADGSLVSP